MRYRNYRTEYEWARRFGQIEKGSEGTVRFYSPAKAGKYMKEKGNSYAYRFVIPLESLWVFSHERTLFVERGVMQWLECCDTTKVHTPTLFIDGEEPTVILWETGTRWGGTTLCPMLYFGSLGFFIGLYYIAGDEAVMSAFAKAHDIEEKNWTQTFSLAERVVETPEGWKRICEEENGLFHAAIISPATSMATEEDSAIIIWGQKAEQSVSPHISHMRALHSLSVYLHAFPNAIRPGPPGQDSIYRLSLPTTKKMRDSMSSGQGHSSPVSHFRHGHFRELRDKRYKRNSDGTIKIVFVRGCIVNKAQKTLHVKTERMQHEKT